ncbi:hypothetical protein DFP72DRAFT_201399 [Ephemerocybe angulata]|uniref:Uncharacterized protein n=1 Tax=Ephemerocybe angulata TaxID=980116 RepID=A0A8H6MDH9_9AGAR|nr:hypothetical protein DFP72DRAFT_201399 [Tulosesus angulatus]
MTLIQIQRAAVGPHLFGRRLQHRGASSDTPLAEVNYLEPVSGSSTGSPKHIYFSQLVAGGRFVVMIHASVTSAEAPATNGTPSLTMELVDLGHPALPVSSERALMYVYPNIGPIPRGMVVVASMTITSQNPDTLRVALPTADTEGSCVASIFAITPTNPVHSTKLHP